MAENSQTIAQVPYDITDDVSMQRFLNQLVERLDIVLGFRGDTTFITDEDLSTQGVNLQNLSGQLSSLSAALATLQETSEQNSEDIEALQESSDSSQYVTETQILDSSYYNFNASVWSTLRGKGEFSASGSAITNPPTTIGSSDSAIVMADSIGTSNSVWQTVFLVVTSGSTTTRSCWTRRGVNSDWLQLG